MVWLTLGDYIILNFKSLVTRMKKKKFEFTKRFMKRQWQNEYTQNLTLRKFLFRNENLRGVIDQIKIRVSFHFIYTANN